MMLRRIIAVVLIFSHLSVLTVSCTDERTAAPEPARTADRGRPALGAINDPGQFHNDILEAFNRGNVLMSGAPLDQDAFIERFRDATNTVLAERGMAATIERKDVEQILERFEAYRSLGLFDFNSRDTGRIRAIDYSVERGDIDEIDAERLDTMLRELAAIEFSPSNQGRVRHLIDRHARRLSADGDGLLGDALDVADHSYQFWTDLLGDEPTPAEKGGGPERITTWWMNYAVADMVAALFFGSAGPWGLVIAAAISVAFYMATHPGD